MLMRRVVARGCDLFAARRSLLALHRSAFDRNNPFSSEI